MVRGKKCMSKQYKDTMHVGIVQKGSACAHWYAKVCTSDTVLIPTVLVLSQSFGS